jgi:hypothetical protein
MKTSTDIKEANNLLEFYSGATFQIVMYSASLKRMAFRLILSNVNEVLYIIGIGCESINGHFNYNNANLNITKDVNNDSNTIITDKLAGFTLITSSGFTIAQGIESEFGTSFDNFLTNNNV